MPRREGEMRQRTKGQIDDGLLSLSQSSCPSNAFNPSSFVATCTTIGLLLSISGCSCSASWLVILETKFADSFVSLPFSLPLSGLLLELKRSPLPPRLSKPLVCHPFPPRLVPLPLLAVPRSSVPLPPSPRLHPMVPPKSVRSLKPYHLKCAFPTHKEQF